jgi:hypothetical protein
MRFMLAAFLAAFSFPAVAEQRVCDYRAAIVVHLAEHYGERQVATGTVVRHGKPLSYELFVNLKTRTWTAILTGSAGVACLVGAGRDWRVMQPGQPT